jgi:hypothetical protein
MKFKINSWKLAKLIGSNYSISPVKSKAGFQLFKSTELGKSPPWLFSRSSYGCSGAMLFTPYYYSLFSKIIEISSALNIVKTMFFLSNKAAHRLQNSGRVWIPQRRLFSPFHNSPNLGKNVSQFLLLSTQDNFPLGQRRRRSPILAH